MPILGVDRNVGLPVDPVYCDERVTSMLRSSRIKTAEKVLANHPMITIPENWVLYNLDLIKA